MTTMKGRSKANFEEKLLLQSIAPLLQRSITSEIHQSINPSIQQSKNPLRL
jgi:hypothetical protein